MPPITVPALDELGSSWRRKAGKGLINDLGLDDTFDVNRGLRTARKLLLDVTALGLPVGCEFLDPITPQFIADVVSWGSIGARTAASRCRGGPAAYWSVRVNEPDGYRGWGTNLGIR